jgi:multicomponent Na+:H+ antiporter subunit E
MTLGAATGWRAMALRAALLGAGWWILAAGEGAPWFGVPIVLAALAASAALPASGPARWRPLGLLRFALAFVAGSVRGGIDVAGRALAPRLRIAPAFLEQPLRLPAGPARNLFTGTVSLMPGTLSIDVHGQRLRLHVLAGGDPALARQLQELEQQVARTLGERLEGADA